MPCPVIKEGLLTETNCAITQEQLESIIRRDQSITDHYEVEKDCFARGKFAQVRRIIHKKTGNVFAAKCIKRRRPRCGDVTDEIRHEIRVLLTADSCPRIVKVHEVFETRTEYILVLELAEGGELQQILDEDERIEEQVCRRLLRQIVEGVRFLHSHQIAHLDIKPQNILLTGALPAGEAKLCDFGISRHISASAEIREIMGTTDYMPPEILQYEPISLASDIWSVGIVAYVLLSGHTPFGGDDKVETYSNITSGELEFPETLFGNVSEQGKDFIRRCLVRVPSDRMTCEECLEHDWLAPQSIAKSGMAATNGCDSIEAVLVSNSGAISGDEEHNEDEKSDLNCEEADKCTSLSISTSDFVNEPLANGHHPALADAGQVGTNQNFCCDTHSGQTVSSYGGEKMDISNQTLSYDSDKENVERATTVTSTTEKTKQLLTDLSASTISFNNLSPFYKSHKRLSSDIFPSSDHQKLIAVVAAGSSSPSCTLKKYTSESAMSTAGNSGTVSEQSSSTRTLFTSTRNDSNNNLTKEHSAAIDVPIIVEGSSAVSANNESSPPSTPNKKIYLSIDDSFCHFGASGSETSKLMITKLSPSMSSPHTTSLISPGVCRIRSVSVERLNTSARVEANASEAAFCIDSKIDHLGAQSPFLNQNYQFTSSSTMSSSSNSSSLSSIVSTIKYSRIHQQISSQVSSPGC